MIEHTSHDKQKKAVSKRYSAFSFFLVMVLGTLLFSSCGTSRRAGSLSSLELQSDVTDSVKRQFLLTSTKHVDSAKPSDIQMEISRIETKSYPQEIRLFAKIFDTTGHYITHIAPPYSTDQRYWYLLKEKLGRSNVTIDSFRVREYGDADSIPYAIMLSVDFSGSMTGVMDAIAMGTELFVNMKQPQDRIGISTFAKDYTLKVPMWKDKEIIVNKFKSTFLEGQGYYSGLYDAIMKSMEAFTTEIPDTVPKVIVIFSDGEDNYSKTRLKMILDTAKTKGVNIFTVGFGYPNDEIMRQISQYTGGKYYREKTKE